MKIDTKPMMSDEEIEIINDLLKKHKPKRCLEWGSGMSTVYFPSMHPQIDLWLSVEHNGHYLDHIRDKCPANVQTLWVLEDSSYADVVQRSNQKFDFILIDGLHREKCLDNAMEILSDGGIALLHDAGRKDYQKMIRRHNGKMLTEGEKPVNGGGFAHRGLAIFGGQHGA